LSWTATQRGKALAGATGRNALAFLDHMIALGIAGQIGEIRGMRIVSDEGLIG
jgi:hypothetical protein